MLILMKNDVTHRVHNLVLEPKLPILLIVIPHTVYPKTQYDDGRIRDSQQLMVCLMVKDS